MDGRTMIFRREDEPDEVVEIVTPYVESPAEIERCGVLWIQSGIEEGRPVFRPKAEIEPDD